MFCVFLFKLPFRRRSSALPSNHGMSFTFYAGVERVCVGSTYGSKRHDTIRVEPRTVSVYWLRFTNQTASAVSCFSRQMKCGVAQLRPMRRMNCANVEMDVCVSAITLALRFVQRDRVCLLCLCAVQRAKGTRISHANQAGLYWCMYSRGMI